jgi:hypothetical protein
MERSTDTSGADSDQNSGIAVKVAELRDGRSSISFKASMERGNRRYVSSAALLTGGERHRFPYSAKNFHRLGPPLQWPSAFLRKAEHSSTYL